MIEITCDVTTYVCAIVAAEVRSGDVVFGLGSDDRVGTRKRRQLMASAPDGCKFARCRVAADGLPGP